MSKLDANREVFDRDAAVYTDLALMPPERRVMSMLRDRLSEMEMLDIGIGAGRTAYTFSGLVRRYVGIDYSPRMIERARALLDGESGTELKVGDARDLSSVGGPFDFVLFSFNGIDAVGHEDRGRILAGVRNVLKPDGSFFFSAHSTGALPLSSRRWGGGKRADTRSGHIYDFAKDARFAWKVRKSNREIDLAAIRERGWGVVRDGAHRFDLQVYYVDPAEQLSQLSRAGLDVTAVFDGAGREIEPLQRRRDPSLHYLCRPL